MGRTFQEALAKATAADHAEGEYVSHRSNAVLFQMLDLVGRRARGEQPDPALERQVRETRQILKAQQLARANRMFAARASAAQALRSAGGQGAGSLEPQKPDTRPLVKSVAAGQRRQIDDDAKLRAVARAAHAAKKPDDAKVRQAALASLSPEQLAAAVDAAVVSGRISGTDAMALLKRIRAKG